MQFAFTGALVPRVDSGGNLGIFDQNGTEVAKFVGGVFTSKTNLQQAAIGGANVTTTSTTFVSTGIGVQITPQTSKKVVYWVYASLTNNTGGDGAAVQIFFNTTGIPANGTAVGSDTAAGANVVSGAGGTSTVSGVGTSNVNNLVVGTTYFFYIALEAITGGTASLLGGGATPPITASIVAIEA